MKYKNRTKFIPVIIFVFFMIISLTGCSSSLQVLTVNYYIGNNSPVNNNPSVSIEAVDERLSEGTLSNNVKGLFPDWKEMISLKISRDFEEAKLEGIFQPKDMLARAIEKKFSETGFHFEQRHSGIPIFRVILEQMQLDIINHTWIATVRYRVELHVDSHTVYTRTVNGKAEKTRIAGRKGADEVLSQAITEAVNALDPERIHRALAENI